MEDVSNTKYGYGSGAFPFFSFIKNGEYASGSVIYNDSVIKEDGKYKISNSYYTKERVKNLQYTSTVLKGKTIPKSDVDIHGKYFSWNNEKANAIYEDILNDFLDYVLPKVTHKF